MRCHGIPYLVLVFAAPIESADYLTWGSQPWLGSHVASLATPREQTYVAPGIALAAMAGTRTPLAAQSPEAELVRRRNRKQRGEAHSELPSRIGKQHNSRGVIFALDHSPGSSARRCLWREKVNGPSSDRRRLLIDGHVRNEAQYKAAWATFAPQTRESLHTG